MKYIEIILKLLFVGISITAIMSSTFFVDYMYAFLIVSFILGLVLCFNREQSYGYQLSEREVKIRRIEGGLLVLFSVVCVVLRFKEII
jgi:hypothetical protein